MQTSKYRQSKAFRALTKPVRNLSAEDRSKPDAANLADLAWFACKAFAIDWGFFGGRL
jgi:hypothetical protein